MRTLFDKPRAMTLRDYQDEAVDAIARKLDTHQSCIVVMATGLGKTVVMAEDARRVVESGKRVLALAHRRELVEQMAATMTRLTGVTADIEMAEDVAGHGRTRSLVVCASKDSLRHRLHRYDPSEFGRIYTDEAHHAVGKSYRKIYDHFEGVPHVGFTATPDRADQISMGKVFDSVAYDMHIADGIAKGWLVPVRQRFVKVKTMRLREIETKRGDYDITTLAEMSEQDQNVLKMSHAAMELCGRERCLVFCVRVRHAEKVVAVLNEHGRAAACVHGKMKKEERADIFRRFADGSIQYLANVGIAVEGWDDPATDGRGVQYIAMMRPTRSRNLYAQMLGRGTRPLAGTVEDADTPDARKARIASSTKPGVTVLDFVGVSADHQMVHATDVLGGRMDADVVFRAKQNLRRGEGGEDALLDLLVAKTQLEEEAEAERLAKMRVKVEYETRDIHAPDSWAFVPRPVTGREPVSRVTFDKCAKYGIDAHGMSEQQAKAELRKADRPSLKQAKMFKFNGVPEAKIAAMSRQDASAWMNEIVKYKHKGWRLPRDHPWLREAWSTYGRK